MGKSYRADSKFDKYKKHPKKKGFKKHENNEVETDKFDWRKATQEPE